MKTLFKTTRFTAVGISLLTAGLAQQTLAQQDVLKRPAVYRLPGMDEAIVKRDVTYKRAGDISLKFDAYYPAGHKSGLRLPVVIFVNGVGNPAPPTPPLREWGQYTSWPRLIAATGLIAVSFDSRQGESASDTSELVAYIRNNASALDVDESRLCLWSCSANVPVALSLASAHDRAYIRAAVFYYGVMNIATPRLDLPTLVVRAGHDVPAINKSIDQFTAKSLAADAPITLINYVGAQHGFDLVDDNDESRQVIKQTLDFIKCHLSKPSYEAASRIPTPTQFSDLIAREGIERALKVFADARAAAPGDVLFRENTINALGYELLQNGKTRDAIELFKLNVAAYPESPNAYDSLSEAYEADGNKELAVQNAGRALKLLERDNGNVPEQLKTAIREASSARLKKLTADK